MRIRTKVYKLIFFLLKNHAFLLIEEADKNQCGSMLTASVRGKSQGETWGTLENGRIW
jgi:hypothetical protein